MCGDPIHVVEGLGGRVRALETRVIRLTALRNRVVSDIESKQHEVSELSQRIEKLAKVLELYRHLLDSLVLQQVKSVEDVVTEALREVFYDQNLSLESELSLKYGKVAVDFFFRQGERGHLQSHRGKPLENFGGGPSSVTSLALRVLTVLKLKRWPFVAMDESLGAVSDEYLEQASRFTQKVAKELGVDLLLVTHKPVLLEHADRSYRCTDVAEDDGVTHHLSLRSLK
jgi:chromosome segregation ATPase